MAPRPVHWQPLRELVLYCARHDFGSFVLAKTGNLKAVMNAIGHGDVRSATVYQHIERDVIYMLVSMLL